MKTKDKARAALLKEKLEKLTGKKVILETGFAQGNTSSGRIGGMISETEGDAGLLGQIEVYTGKLNPLAVYNGNDGIGIGLTDYANMDNSDEISELEERLEDTPGVELIVAIGDDIPHSIEIKNGSDLSWLEVEGKLIHELASTVTTNEV